MFLGSPNLAWFGRYYTFSPNPFSSDWYVRLPARLKGKIRTIDIWNGHFIGQLRCDAYKKSISQKSISQLLSSSG